MEPITKTRASRESGVTLIETMIAALILLVGVIAIMRLMAVAVGQNLSQGDVQTRVSEYAEDKMEQLMALSFTDVSTNTTVFPPTTTGGVGLGGRRQLQSFRRQYQDILITLIFPGIFSQAPRDPTTSASGVSALMPRGT